MYVYKEYFIHFINEFVQDARPASSTEQLDIELAELAEQELMVSRELNQPARN